MNHSNNDDNNDIDDSDHPNDRGKSFATNMIRTFGRSLLIPSLLEEILWRVILQPPGSSVLRMVGVNVAFSLYHTVGSVFLAERLDGRPGARTVFCNPVFLSLAFVLGNACSWCYVRSGHALWAPVLTHAVVVTIWLTCGNGETALSTPGGLSRSDNDN